MTLRCVIFDLDNTLVDSDLDFGAIRAEIGTDQPILEYRAGAEEKEKRRVDEILDRHESRAAVTCRLSAGARELLDFLAARAISAALMTRNSRKSVETVMKRLDLRFDMVLSREDSSPKPSPEPVFIICRRLRLTPDETLVVGDYLYDVQCGQAAGAPTMLVDGPNRARFTATPDYEVKSLREAIPIIRTLIEQGG